MSEWRAAAVQMASGPGVSANLAEAARLVGEAVDEGARLVVLPENFGHMGQDDRDAVKVREQPGSGPMQDFLAEQAARHGIWLVGGTVPLAAEAPEKVRAACLVYDPSGALASRYDKIHLFDVTVGEEHGETYTESRTIEPGDRVVTVDTPLARLGIAVCYDLRFPELFRAMIPQGVEVLVLPAAFTAVTGRAHWEVLLRARAVENLSYLVAAAQGGFHLGGRETYGHTMVVDPWGSVMDQLNTGAGVVVQTLDLERARGLRQRFPALEHVRLGCELT